MFIQLILLLIILTILIFVVVRFRKKELTPVQFVFWFLVWIVGGIVVADPGIPQRIANELGIGRGADLVIYVAIIFIVFVLFRMLLRQERMEREITKVVREVALMGYTPRPNTILGHPSQEGITHPRPSGDPSQEGIK